MCTYFFVLLFAYPSCYISLYILFHFRRDIATTVLRSKMLHGYSLLEIQCLRCGMPLMEYKDQIDCVVCPVLAEKAMEKLKEQQEEKKRAEQKAIIEALIAAQEKTEEEAEARAKAEKEVAEAEAKAEEEAAAKAAAEAEEEVTKAAAAEEAKRKEAEKAAMRAAAEEAAAAVKAIEEASVKTKEEEEAVNLAAGFLEFIIEEEEARLAEEERLLDAMENRCIFSEQDSSRFRDVYTSIGKIQFLEIQPNLSPNEDDERDEEPAFAINEEHRNVISRAPLRQMATQEELDAIVSTPTAFMRSETVQMITPLPETAPINMSFEESVHSLTKDAMFLNEPADELEGIEYECCEHKRKMESLIETAVRCAMLPPRPVESDLLHPAEKEELEYERAKSIQQSETSSLSVESPAEPSNGVVATHEITKEYSIRYVYLFFCPLVCLSVLLH